MKKTLRLSALLLVILFALVSCQQDPVVQIPQTPTIRGSVSIPEGTGLTGRDFFIRIMEGEKAVYTGRVGSDGTFSVSGLKEDASYNVLLTTEEPGDVRGSERDVSRAATSGYGGWLSNVSASINEQAGVGSIKVKPLGTIKGVAKKDGAEDNYDTTVYIPGTSYLAMTDGEGNFSLFNVPQATYTLRYTANGYMPKMIDNVVLHSDSDTENPVTTVQLQTLIKNAGNLIGTISKTGSSDHSNITVMISDGENTFTGSTGADGSLLISNIIPGTYTATISTSGFLTQTVEGIVIEAAKNTSIQPINLVANGGSILGTISLNNNGDKAGAIIIAKGVDSDYSYTASTDVEGRFVISNAFPGTYTVTITKTGFTTVTVENVASVAGQTTELGATKLNSLYGSVSGRVLLSDRTDNSGAIITLKSVDNSAIAPTALSGEDGIYSFENLTIAGQYILTFTKDGFVSDSGKTVTVELGSNVRVEDVTLSSLASKITGKVTLEGTDNYTGVNILLIDNQNNQFNTTTDSKGSYVLNGVIPGTYDLYISKTGYESKTTSRIAVGSSITKELDAVSLTAKIKSITGSITLEGKDDYAGALVTATNLSDETLVYSAITNSDGNYTLAGMLAGEYRIVITNTAYRSETLRTVNLTDEPITMERVDLSIARGTIYGSVTLEGRTDYSGITVQIVGKTGSDYTTTTDINGEYSFYVPQGNYAGIRASKEDFQTETTDTVISLFAENDVPIEKIKLNASAVSVFGYVDVKETDDESNVSVIIEGEPSFGTYTTAADGYFRFDHVPVGETYTLRFSRNLCADVTTSVLTKASEGIDLKTINMLADSSAIEGIVSLDGMTNNSGITVYVDTVDGRISTTTDAAGYYYIGGLSTMGSYTVNAEKDGWSSAQTTVSGLVALEVYSVSPLTLEDYTAPVLRKVEINGGSNVTGSKLVSVAVEAEDKGSAISQMRYSWDGNLDSKQWIPFVRLFKVELPEEANGLYTLTIEVMDGVGNTSSSTSSDSIELVGQITTIQPGVLTGDNLHWQAKDNPIVVMGNITVQAKDTLVIDPGVDVLFNGNYSIRVLGKIQAEGTESNPIFFDSTKDHLASVYQNEEFEGYFGYWGGIIVNNESLNVIKGDGYNYSFADGSILSYCTIHDLSEGITGKIYVDHCRIETNKSALGKYNDGNRFNGYLLNSYISGGVAAQDNYSDYAIFGNTFDGTKLLDEPVFEYSSNSFSEYYHWESGDRERVAKNWYEYGYDFEGIHHGHDICEFDFNGIFIEGYAIVNNNIIDYNAIRMNPYREVQFNTFDSCRSISFLNDDGDQNYKYNEFKNISDTIYAQGWSAFTYNNIESTSDDYVMTVIDTNNSVMNYSYNYWGDRTQELQSIDLYGFGNPSFIYDGYSNTNLSIMDLSNYATSAWKFAGYKGARFIDFIVSDWVPEVKVGEDITISITPATTNEINFVRVSQSAEGLDEAQWQSFNGSNVTIDGSAIDRDMLSDDGYLTFFIQAKCGEFETAFKSVRVPSDCPRITNFSLSKTEITGDEECKLTYRIFDSQDYGNHGDGEYARLYVDNILIGDCDRYFCDWNHEFNFWPSNYRNGDHVIKLVVADRAGNESSKEISFTTARPIPTLETVAFEGGTTIVAGGSLNVNLSISNSKHLRYIRFYSDDVNVFERYYEDNGDEARTEIIELDAHYLKAGTHNISVELEDYSGNKTESEEYEFTVEGINAGPVFSSISLKEGDVIGDSFGFSMNVQSEKGIKSVSMSLGDTEIWSDNRDEYSSDRDRLVYSWLGSWDITDRPDGEVEFKLHAVDFAGNETGETRTLIIQKTWPSVKVSVYDKRTTFDVNSEIANSDNIVNTTIYANDIPLGEYSLSDHYGYWNKAISKAKSQFAIGEYTIGIELTNRAGETKRFNAGQSVNISEDIGFVENNLEGVTTIEGILNDSARLHWTTEMSPVVITGNITVASGKTLVIDPGVQVFLEGDYSINVRGAIDARGTKENPIAFRSSAGHLDNHEGYYGTWKGILFPDSLNVTVDGYSVILNSGSVLEHCEISDLSSGVIGRVLIDNCKVEALGYALGSSNGDNFRGIILNSQVYGSVRMNDARIIFGNEFNGSNVVNSYFCYDRWDGNSRFVNNLIYGYSDNVDMNAYNGIFEFNTISDITGNVYFRRNDDQNNGTRYNEFTNISGTMRFGSEFRGFQYSNITELNGTPQIRVESSWGQRDSFDMTNNYWGEANTAELQRASGTSGKNASFIYDGYDNNDLTTVDWDGFVSSPWEFAGYHGREFIDFEVKLVESVTTVNEIKIGDNIPFMLSLKTGDSISKYRIAQSMEELFNEDWQNYSGNCYLYASEIDESKIEDGKIKAFIQIKTLSGAESAPVISTVSYDVPSITFNAIRDGEIISTTSLIPIQADFYDSSNRTHFMTYIDGNLKCDGGYGFLDNGHYNIWGGYPWTVDPANMSAEYDYLDPVKFGNGDHVLTIFAEDRVGNTTMKVIHFTIQIAPPSLTTVELSSGGIVAEGEALSISIRIDNAENLKTVKILSDGAEIISKSVDSRVKTFSDVFSISSDYLRTGEHILQVVMEDYVGGTITSGEYVYTATGDDTSPTIEGFDVTEGQEFTENEVMSWELSVADNTGVKNFFFDVDGVRVYQYIARDLESSSKTIDPTIRFRVYGYQNGEHVLTLTATDFAGNSTVISRAVRVEKTLPTVALYKDYENADSVRYYARLSNRAWMYDGYILIDGEILKYFLINNSNNEVQSEDYWTDALYFDNLPSGTHTLQAVFSSQGGDKVFSDEMVFTNTRSKNDSKYGLNKTWNADGSLIADRGTKYLWNFDDPMGMNYESVCDKNLGTIKSNISGIGSKAGSLYYETNDEISFFNSEWTLEYWAKDEYGGTDNIDIDVRNVINTDNNHSSSNSESHINAWFYYSEGYSDSALNEEYLRGAITSRADRSQWHHYAFVSTGDRCELYLDGILTAYTSGIKVSSRKATGLYISMTDSSFIDELRISDIARSGDELWDYVQYVKSNNLLPE